MVLIVILSSFVFLRMLSDNPIETIEPEAFRVGFELLKV